MAPREVPIRTKLLYATGEITSGAKNAVLNQFLLFFYTDVIHLAPLLVGAAIALAKCWDAITDPVLGYLSDTTRSRWGRRRPYIVAAAIPLGILFALLFSPPVRSPSVTFLYLLGIYALLNTAFTVFLAPYHAWGAQLVSDYHERTTLVQIRFLFGLVGAIIGTAVPVWLASQYGGDVRQGYHAVGIGIGMLLTVAALVPGLTVRETVRAEIADASFSHFLQGLRRTVANRDFRVVFITFCMLTVAGALGEAVRVHVVKHWLKMEDFYPMIGLTFALAFTASFPLWFGLSKRFGKRQTMLGGLVLGWFVPLGWLLVQPGQRGAMLVFMVAAGLASGVVTLITSSAIDVIDFDEYETGERREGAFFGVWTFGLKLSSACGIMLSGAFLWLLGYSVERADDPNVMWWLLMLVGPLQVLVNIIGFVLFRSFRFEQAHVEGIQAVLAERRNARLEPSRATAG